MAEENTIDLSNPEVKKIVDAAIAEATKGLKDNRDAILGEKKTLEEQVKELKGLYEGVDPKIVKTLVERMKNDEETKLIAEGKLDDVFNRRTEALRRDYEARVKAAQELADKVTGDKTSLESRVREMVIEGVIRQAASEVNVRPEALEDAIFRAKRVFQVDESFSPVAKDSTGAILLGKDAKSPLSAKEWLESMKDKAPHWFPGSSGAGAGGSKGDGRGGNTYTISRDDARNPQKYQAAKAAAEKAGQSLQIVE